MVVKGYRGQKAHFDLTEIHSLYGVFPWSTFIRMYQMGSRGHLTSKNIISTIDPFRYLKGSISLGAGIKKVMSP